jgi:hypothetical protein
MSIVMMGEPCTERRWTYDERVYRLDVAFVEDDDVVAAVEVWHTHATTGQKLSDLNMSEIAWCEVRANDVHEAIHRGDHRVRDATKQWLCQECTDKADELARDSAYREHVRSMSWLSKDVALAKADISNAQASYTSAEEELKQEIDALQEHLQALRESIHEQCANARAKRCTSKLSAYMEMLSEVEEWAVRLQQCAGATDWTDLTTMLASPHMTLAFGKYTGRQVEAVFAEDPAYVVWLAGWAYRQFDGNKPLLHHHCGYRATQEQQQSARDLLKGKCIMCFCQLDQVWKNRCISCYYETR